MSDDAMTDKDIRDQTRRILQLMNHYSLMEIEYEDKDSDTSITIRRDSQESSPPLLEGRSKDIPGEIRSPTVGELHWKRKEHEEVERGEIVGEITKKDETVPIKAPRTGTLADVTEASMVEFGETLGRVVVEPEFEDEEEQ